MFATKYFGGVEVGDQRLVDRVVNTVTLFGRNVGAGILQACGSWKASKGAYRLWSNPRVKEEALKSSVQEQVARECGGQERIGLIQDTTTLTFGAVNRIEGLGPVNDAEKKKGLLLHSGLALGAKGKVLGLLHHEVWSRNLEQQGQSERRRERDFEDKESFKWVKGMQRSRQLLQQVLPQERRPDTIHVQDREGDIYEVFRDVIEAGEGAMIRCAQDRRVWDTQGREGKAKERVRQAPLLERHQLAVRRTKHPAERVATVEIRAVRLELRAPSRCGADAPSLWLNLLEVWEPNPPAEVEAAGAALHWLLWTTEPTDPAAQTNQVVQGYQSRWGIEEVHLILKEGCKVEKLQLESAERIKKALAIYLPLAVQLMHLKTVARQEPQAPCTVVLSELEWKTLWKLMEPPMSASEFPTSPPSVAQAVAWIGRLGGHLNRRRDGPPGVRTLWRGWRQLQFAVQVRRIFGSCRPEARVPRPCGDGVFASLIFPTEHSLFPCCSRVSASQNELHSRSGS